MVIDLLVLEDLEFYFGGFGRIVEGVDGFIVMSFDGVDASNHNVIGPARQPFLDDAGEFRIPVGDMVVPLL